jgi:hypothetical protein
VCFARREHALLHRALGFLDSLASRPQPMALRTLPTLGY